MDENGHRARTGAQRVVDATKAVLPVAAVAAMISVVVAIVLYVASVASVASTATARVDELRDEQRGHEVRLRQLETASTRAEERYLSIQQDLSAIRAALERLERRP
jgi:hypothetical protein